MRLDGIYYPGGGSDQCIIHVHGSLGNFYGNEFIRVFAHLYQRAGFAFLSFNLSAHDGLAEGIKDGQTLEYVGGSVSRFEDCVDDIAAAIRFVGPQRRIVLQGHSLGCDRVLHYSIATRDHRELILLAPCDSYALQARWLGDESVEAQLHRLRATTAPILDWLPLGEYGVRQGPGWDYAIPITRAAFTSIADGPPFRLIRLDSPADFTIRQRVAVYIGGKDTLQTGSSQDMFGYFERRCASVRRIFVPQGDHMLARCGERIATELLDWLQRSY